MRSFARILRARRARAVPYPGSRIQALLLRLCASVVCLTGCAAQRAQLPAPLRAIWVTRFDYRTPDDVTAVVGNCADAGFNAILFQVRGHGTAHYRSNFEPWDDSLGGKDPGWDPLELAIREARSRRVQLHAWVNVMPAWRGLTPPANPEQLYNRHPEWFWYDQHGDRQALSPFYVSVNPCLPEVREYLVAVFRDIVARYEIDGLHLDYIRFPNEPPARPRGRDVDYPYDGRTLALYRAQAGLAPQDDLEAWNRWRTECVTRLVADIRAMMRNTRPRAALTAAVGSVRRNALTHFQDGQRWMNDDLVDALLLMNYTDSMEEFGQRIDPWLTARTQPAVRIVPGLSIGSHLRKPHAQVVADVKRQIEVAREKTGDVCVFAYSYLFDSADEGELERGTPAQREARRARREALLPYLRSLAQAAR